MDDYNQEDVTKYTKLDPTLPVAPDPYSDPVVVDSTEKGLGYYRNPYDIPIPPPPPMKNTKRAHPYRRYIFGFCTFLIVCVIGATVFFFTWQNLQLVVSHQNATPTVTTPNLSKSVVPSSTPTAPPPNYEYTAMDIVQHMQEVDKNTSIESTNVTIWDWSNDNYFISVHASSSVQWIGCPFASIQQCAGTWHNGLWVYADGNEATSAWQQVASDSLACDDTSPASKGIYVSCGQQEAEYLHGRCLLLGDDAQSIYGQIVTQYCY
jgi:hypothetical protein